MVTDLEPIIQHINLGNYKTAERELESYLLHNPKIIDAWLLLGQLRNNPSRKADCYRQVLSIDPGNHRAESRLKVIEKQIRESPQEEPPPPPKKNGPIRCPKCEAVMEIRHNGKSENDHAFCVFCGTNINLAESFRRATKRLTLEQRLNEKPSAEKPIIRTTNNGNGRLYSKDKGTLVPELQEMLLIIKEKGPEGIDEEFLQYLRSNGIIISFDPDAIDPYFLQGLQNGDYDDSLGTKLTRSFKSLLLQSEEKNEEMLEQLLFGLGITREKSKLLTTEEILALDVLASVGKPLSADDRQKCPNPACGAVISKNIVRCPWCGIEFS